MIMSKAKLLDNIRVVMIHTSHPGNIGSAARAMKTMGLSDLCLVRPKSFPDEQATALASNATDVLDKATVVDTLEEAIAECHLVIGASARRKRSLTWEQLDSRACGELIAKQSISGKAALVFGRERTGLTNEELAMCQYLVHIPANPDYSSLNIASAVQILSYECRMGMDKTISRQDQRAQLMDQSRADNVVSSDAMLGYYDQLQALMIQSGFLDPEEPRYLMQRLRRLYGRVRLRRSELNILRGMLASFEKKMRIRK